MRGRLWRLTGGLALLLSGCYSSPYYYGAQPYGAPGSMYGAPYQQYPSGGYPAPGGTYIPQNSNGISPTPIAPGSGSGVNAPPTFRPDGGSNAPAYPGNGADKPVPRPDAGDFGVDPNTSNRPPASDGFDDSPFKPSSALPMGSPTVAAGPLPGNPSALPMPMPVEQVAQVGGRAPDDVQFGHDAAKYTWLQGIVAYDDIDQTWSILYSLSPSAQDRFGGDLTLATDPARFAGMRNETAVRLEGFVDPQMKDSRGKPVYRITSIKPLVR